MDNVAAPVAAPMRGGGPPHPPKGPKPPPRPPAVDGDDGPYGYDGDRPPFLLGFELLDRHGCVLERVEPHGMGTFEPEGLYQEADATLELEVEREVAAVNVVVATEVRVVEVPFEADLRIWVRDARGVISGEDSRGR